MSNKSLSTILMRLFSDVYLPLRLLQVSPSVSLKVQLQRGEFQAIAIFRFTQELMYVIDTKEIGE